MTASAEEFQRRFLICVLLEGLVRICASSLLRFSQRNERSSPLPISNLSISYL
jgi:hypothetical protein